MLLIGGIGFAPPAFAQSAANWAVDTSANTAANAGIWDDLAAAGWGTGYNTLPIAATPGLPLKAAPLPPPPTWWFHGFVEVGGRGFTNDPQDGGAMWQGSGRSSLAKYYEYSDVAPGAFGNFWLATGTSNGLWETDAWGKNVGYDDQRYIVDLSKAGEHYLTFGWDQTPHTYSDGATTLFGGVGTDHLTIATGLANQLFQDAGCTFGAGGPGACGTITNANANKVRQDILNNGQQIGLGIQRDTASLDYRYTPNDSWDVRANYTNTRREGTQVDGVVMGASTSGVVVQAPKPVHDTTQNYGASAEYNGTSFWNQTYNIKLAYSGSTYTDDSDSYLVDNPFCSNQTTQGDQCARNGAVSSFTDMMSLWPNNQANGGTATLGMNLPWQSRYMGTASYTVMTQNDTFLPFTNISAFANNGGLSVPTGWKGIPGVPVNSLAALPATSLNGDINTLLLNNVVTTQLTSDVKSKLSYRYYDYDNQTPELGFLDWVQSDATSASLQSGHAPVRSLSMSYTKQNAGADFNWRPSNTWNLGAAYGFERYDFSRFSVTATNENIGKLYADYKPFGWMTARGSIGYGARRADNYNYLGNYGVFQWPATGSGSLFANTDRQFYLDDRNRWLGKLQVDIALSPTVTVSPSVSFRNDAYLIDPFKLQGLNTDESTTAGIELDYVMDSETNLMLAYMYETEQQRMNVDTSGADANGPLNPANDYFATVDDHVQTVMASVAHTFIPNKFDVRASYTMSWANDHQPLSNATQTAPAAGVNFPDVNTLWQRVDVTGIYTFDQDFVHRLGWKGTVKAKLRYAWERNSVANWQNDMMAPYIYSSGNITGTGYMTWLAYDNPNYNVQMITGSIVAGW